MSPEVLAARLDGIVDAIDQLRTDVAEVKLENREGLANVNDTLTKHNGRLRKMEVEQIRKEARAEVKEEQVQRWAKYKVPIVCSVVSALVLSGIYTVLGVL